MRLSQLRRSLHLTQRALADRVGVHYRTIGDWEKGKKIPSFYHAISLAVSLGVDLDTLADIFFTKDEY